MAKVPLRPGKPWSDVANQIWPLLPPSAHLLHAAWHEAVFGPQNFKFKNRPPTESEKAHVAELKRICGVA